MSVSRRDFLALVGASLAGAAAFAVVGRTASASAPSTSGGHWFVRQVGAVSKGAVPITLEHSATGETLKVEACRRGGAQHAVASSRKFDLLLVNNGEGRAQTPREHVAAVRALAEHLDRNVKAVPAPLLTQDARLRQVAELTTTNDDFVTG